VVVLFTFKAMNVSWDHLILSNEIIAADNPKLKSETPWEVGYRGIALEVEDMAKAADYLEGKGIAIAREPVDLGDSFRGEIRDPDGLILELRHWK